MPTYTVEGPDKRTYQIEGPEGATLEQLVAVIKEQGPSFAPPPPASTERTWGEVPSDVAAQALSGVGKLVQLPGQLYGLATGDFAPTGALGLGQRLQERAEEMKSPGLRARETQLSERIQEAERTRGQGAALKEAFVGTLTDPALLAGAGIESLPSIIPGVGAGIGTARAVAQRAIAKGVSEEAAKRAGAAAGVGVAKGVGAVQQGADVGAESYRALFDEFRAQGLSDTDAAERTLNAARAAGASGSIISYLAQSLPGGSALERALIGGERRLMGRVGAAIAGGLKEAPSEALEEGGGQATRNIALREAIPGQPITAGVGEAAGRAAAAGLTLGAGVGAAQRGPAVSAPPAAPPAPPAEAAAPPAPTPTAPTPEAPLPPPQGELFTEAEAPRAPTPEGLAQNKAYYDNLNTQLTQLTRQQERLRAETDRTTDPDALGRLRQQSAETTEQIARVADEMARYAPTIPSVAQEPRIDAEARAEEAARTGNFQSMRQEFDTLQRENQRLRAAYDRAATPEERAAIYKQAEELAPALRTLQESMAKLRPTIPTEAAQRPAVPETQLGLKFDDRIQIQDLPAVGIPMDGGTPAQRGVRSWLRDNVIGKTPAEIRQLVNQDPSLLRGTGLRARVLADLLSQEVTPPAFTETPRAPTPAPAVAPAARPTVSPPPVQRELDLGGAGAGVEVSGRPGQPPVSAAPAAEPGAPAAGGLGGREVSAAPRAGEQAPPAGALATPQQAFEDWLGRVIERRTREAAGREVLDDMEDRGASPREEARTFWRDTYFKLPADAQRRFQQLLQNETGMQPGSAITKDRRAESWIDIAEDYVENELTDNVVDLEGTARGFVALMAEGNRRAQSVAPSAAPAAAPLPAPEVDQAALDAAVKAEADAEKRKARADARKAKAEARKAEADAKRAEEEAKRAEEEAKRAEAAAKAAEEAVTEAAAPAVPEWIVKAQESVPASMRIKSDDTRVVFFTYRETARNGASPVFLLATKDTPFPTPVDASYAQGAFSPADLQYAQQAVTEFTAQDQLQLQAYPDGPFTGSAAPIVGAPTIDPRYVNLLNDLYKRLNLDKTGARIFLTTTKPDSALRDQSKLYGPYARGLLHDAKAFGFTIPFGPDRKDFVLAVNVDSTPDVLISVIGHEFGHIIQKMMLDSAPQATQDAIRKEYDAWFTKTQKGTVGDLTKSRMPPAIAESMLRTAPPGAAELPATQLTNFRYWTKFDEWFADQVSRWLTADTKPLGVVEKFFSAVAAKMRKLVALLNRRETAPAASVQKFLDEMYEGRSDVVQIAEQWRPSRPTEPVTKMQAALVDMPADQLDKLQATAVAMNPGGGSSLGMAQDATSFLTKFRTRVADKAATVFETLGKDFSGAVRNSLGKVSSEPLYRQAEASDQLIPAFLRLGALAKDRVTGLWRAVSKPNIAPPAEVIKVVEEWGKRNNLPFEKAWTEAGKIMEAARQKEFQDLNASMAKGRQFPVSMSDADIQKYYQIYSTDPTFNTTLRKILDGARFDLIDNMVKSGRIPKELADDWKTATAYIPFDRDLVNDIESAFRANRRFGRGIAQLGQANPQLIDAAQLNRPVKNALENYFNWMGWGVRQVVQNDAAAKTMLALRKQGAARVLPGGQAQVNSNNKPLIVKTYIRGNEVFFETASTYHAAAFNMTIAPLPEIFNVFGRISQVLRTAITAIPTFTATQIPQDIQRAIMYSGVQDKAALTARVLANFGEFSKAAILGKLPQVTHELGEYGVAGDFDFRNDEAADAFLKSVGAKPRTGGKLGELVQRLSDVARASDFALRRAIYEQTIAEGGEKLLALHRAREIINFRRYGMGDQLGVVHMLTQVIPFYNAYIQGMDVLYRSLTGKDAASGLARKAALTDFYKTAGYVVAVATVYALAKSGDEEYENADLRERDKTWMIDKGFGIPVPSELGILFKALPERVLEAMLKRGTPDEAVAGEAVVSWFRAVFDEYAGRSVVPAAIKPFVENLTNYSFLTGRALEGTYQQQLLPSERTTGRTSELAKEIARFTADTTTIQVSPIKIDNFLQGFFGTTASLMLATTDSLINPDKMDRPLHQMVGLSAFGYDPVGTRRAGEFYEVRDKVVQSQNTLNALMKTDIDRATKFADQNAETLSVYKLVNSTLKEIERTRAYRNWLNTSEAAQSMTQKERADAMEDVKKYEQQLFEWVRYAKTQMKL